jgi:pimeloyl-ACP methyl ester carboxylesterase
MGKREESLEVESGAPPAPGRSRLAYHAYPGTEGTAIFLHGVLASHRYFEGPLVGRLGGFRLVLPDLFGHGDSEKPPGAAYTLDEHCALLADLVASEGRPAPLVLGAHSLGCLILTALAARLPPGRISGLVFLNYPRFASPWQIHETLVAGSAEYRTAAADLDPRRAVTDGDLVRSSGAMVRQFAAILPPSLQPEARRASPEALAGTVRHCLFGYQPDADLGRLAQIPQLHLHGGRDRVAPPAFIESRMPEFGLARWVLLAGAGHHLLQTHTDRAAAEILTFLRSVAGRG